MNTTKKFLSLAMAMIMLCSVFSVAVSAAAKVKISSCTFSYSKTKYCTGKAIKPAVTVKYNGKKLKKGTDYTLSYSDNKEVGTAKIVVKGKGAYTGSKTLSFKIKLAKPKNLKASSIKATSVKLTWSKVPGAVKYTVLKYNSSTKKYGKLLTVKKNAATVKNLTSAKKYKLAVKAYDKNGKASAVSAIVTVNTRPATPKLKLKVLSNTSIQLSWNKISRAAGYKIYSFDEATNKYKRIKTIKDGATLTYTKKGLKEGTTYTFAVAAYYTSGSKTILSEKSSEVSGTTKGTPAEASPLDQYLDIIHSRKFTINYKITLDGTTVKSKTVVSGNIVSSTMETSLEGMDATMYLWYDSAKKSGIVRAKAMGVFKFYDTYGEKEAKENGMGADMMVTLFAPEKEHDGLDKNGYFLIKSKNLKGVYYEKNYSRFDLTSAYHFRFCRVRRE